MIIDFEFMSGDNTNKIQISALDDLVIMKRRIRFVPSKFSIYLSLK